MTPFERKVDEDIVAFPPVLQRRYTPPPRIFKKESQIREGLKSEKRGLWEKGREEIRSSSQMECIAKVDRIYLQKALFFFKKKGFKAKGELPKPTNPEFDAPDT